MASKLLTRATCAALPALLLVLLAAPGAGAQPSAADRETARTLMDDGDHKTEAHDDAGALRSYRAADGIMHVPSTGIEVAKALVRTGQLVEAVDQALAVIRMPRAEPEPAPFLAARAEAERLAASLGARIPTLTLHVSGLGRGEVPIVHVDGETVTPDALAFPRRANPGPHHIEAHVATREDVARDVQLAEGQTASVELAFGPPLPGASAPAGEAAHAPAALPALPLQETPPSRAPSAGTWAALGVGAAGLVVGTVAGVLELSKASTLKGKCNGDACPSGERGDLNDANTLANVSNVGFAVGVVGVAVGAVLYLVSPRGGAASSAGAGVGVVRGAGTWGVGASF